MYLLIDAIVLCCVPNQQDSERVMGEIDIIDVVGTSHSTSEDEFEPG